MKKPLFSLAIIFFSTINFCSAQVTFQKSFGGALPDWGSSVKQTTDGGYIVAGNTMSGSSINLRSYLIKTNAGGDLLWTKTFIDDIGVGDLLSQEVQQTVDGGYILLASGVYNSQYAHLIKTDDTGQVIWTMLPRANGIIYQFTGNSAQQTSDSGFIIAGAGFKAQQIVTDTVHAVLIKTNKNGEIIWSKSYGGSKSEAGSSVLQTNDSGYIMTGYTTSFGADSTDVYLVKTNVEGDTLWTRTFGGGRNDVGSGVKQTRDNGYVIVGYTNSFGAGKNDVYLIKTNSDGNLLWSKTYGGMGSDAGTSIQLTADGGYIITGNTYSFGANGIYLIKTDSLGNEEWSKILNGSDGTSAVQTVDGGYVITGRVTYSSGDADVLLVKTDQTGNSGCNEADATTITTTAATQMFGTTTKVYSKSFTNSNVPYILGSTGTETTLCTSVGLIEIKSSLPLLISPNPSSGDFVITFPGIINQGTVEIYTVLGARVFSKEISLSTNIEVNLQNNSPGIYYVKVLDGERRYSQKILIEK